MPSHHDHGDASGWILAMDIEYATSVSEFPSWDVLPVNANTRTVQDVPDPKDPATWTFQLQVTSHKVPGQDVTSLEFHKKRAETFGEPFRSANLWIPEGTRI